MPDHTLISMSLSPATPPPRRLRHKVRIRHASPEEAYSLLSRIPELRPMSPFDAFRERLVSAQALLLVAEADNNLAGCKVGYDVGEQEFYSWLGGVLPPYRRCGIAAILLREQERILAESGYRSVGVKSVRPASAMQLLLQKEGYACVGIETASRGDKLLFEKQLPPVHLPELLPLDI